MYLPTNLRGDDYVDKIFIEVIEAAFIVDFNLRADAN